MIFVIAGMHTAGFDRLIRVADDVAAHDTQEWIAQIGSSTYVPLNMTWFRFCPKAEFDSIVQSCDWLLTHGGYTTVEALLAGKRVIAVPRRRELSEAIDNHQVTFVKWLASRSLVHMAESEAEIESILRSRALSRGGAPEARITEILARRGQLRAFISGAIRGYARKSRSREGGDAE